MFENNEKNMTYMLFISPAAKQCKTSRRPSMSKSDRN